MSALPSVLLVVTLVALLLVHARSVAARVAVESILLAAVGATLAHEGISPLFGSKVIDAFPNSPLLRALAVVWWLIAARLIATGTAIALGRDVRSRQARLFSDLVAGAIYLTAIVIILNSVLGLPIKGLLATSGLIAIVLGLALQNTLADLFSGIAVGVEQPFHVGDRVTIGDYDEGVIVEMNWRSIRIQTDGHDLATIPNSIVAKSQITNRSLPTERRSTSVEIPVQTSARSELLIELIRQATLLCTAILVDPMPSIRISAMGVRTTTFSVSYSVADTDALSAARGQLLKQTLRLFRYAGISDGCPPSDSVILQGLALFESLSPDHIERLATELAARRLETGDTLFEQGSVGALLYIIRSGVFEISHEAENGHPRLLGRAGPGEYLGEISMMSGDPRPVRVAALTASEVLELPRTALEDLIRSDGRLATALEDSMKRGLARLDRDAAARSSNPLDNKGSLLNQIRQFLRKPLSSRS